MTVAHLSLYRQDLTTVAELRNIVAGYALVTEDHEFPLLWVRGTFEDVKTGDLIFGYGSWILVTKLGNKYMTLFVDGHDALAKPYEHGFDDAGKFDVKIGRN